METGIEVGIPAELTSASLTVSGVPPAVAVFDIDGVVRDVAGSYLRALADTVEHFTAAAFRPTLEQVDALKAEGLWNNDWEAAQELIYRYFEAQGQSRTQIALNYDELVDFFQLRYRGVNWSGYIQDEPLLLSATYLADLTAAQIPWGFFSGATRGSATFVLEQRLGLKAPVLVAMEDAPGKPDPTGLIATVEQLVGPLSLSTRIPIFYVGDTVADMQTVQRAAQVNSAYAWLGIGVVPPHVQSRQDYAQQLSWSGAIAVFDRAAELTPEQILKLIQLHVG